MENIPIELLLTNERTKTLYQVDDGLNRLLMSVELFGILEPLKVFKVQEVKEYQIVSGNRRLLVAQKIGLKTVPCVICEPLELEDDIVMAHQEQRVKLRSEYLREVTVLHERYGIYLKQGKPSSINEVRKARELRDLVEKEIGGKHVSQQLRTYARKAQELSNGDEMLFQKELSQLDKAKSLSGAIRAQEHRLSKLTNAKAKEVFEFMNVPFAELRCKSSRSLEGIIKDSINLIFTSPPYYLMRDYDNGTGELGQERSVDEFIKNLVAHFDDCRRVLAKDGTLWVNLMDTNRDFQFQLVPEKFALEMVKRGWLLHDKQIWLKSNARWSDVSHSLAVHEYIFIFKKSAFVKFDDSWAKEFCSEDGTGFTYGNKNGHVRLRSVIDYRDGVIKVPTANNSVLAKECQKSGIRLTHSATFPITLPVIAILSCTEPGDTIVDCFSGTATTGEAVLRVGGGRRYIGYELNLEYCMQANVRLRKTANDLESQGLAA